MRPLRSCSELVHELLCRLCNFVRGMMGTSQTHSRKGGPVKVYILMGQSNMLGEGKVHGNKEGTLEYAVQTKGLYSYLINDENEWKTSDQVRNVRVMNARNGKMHVYNNEFMNPDRSDTIGPEIGIGSMLEASIDGPIMLLKSCIGNRSLGWDLLPPGSARYDYKDKTYAGYKDCPASWEKGKPKPEPDVDWYAGKQYDTDIANAKTVLRQLDSFYPDASNYEIAGFFWWQGDKDRYDEAYAGMYERNLVRLIQQLRAEFKAPKAKFVLATLGQTDKDKAKGCEKMIIDAMLAVDGASGQYPDFVGNVSTVYSHPLSKGGASNGHYNGNAETHMNVGEAMGKAMVELSPSAIDAANFQQV
eukprot:scaffold3389_cov119-Cylindrotheca_fusiformis.AAC.9